MNFGFSMNFGWIAPSGNFYPCRMFKHVEMLKDSSELRRLCEYFDLDMARLSNIKAECRDLISDGEHPEWHTYEMAFDNFVGKVRTTLLAAGCLRVATWSQHASMHFEGIATAITFRVAKDLAEEHNLTPVFEAT